MLAQTSRAAPAPVCSLYEASRRDSISQHGITRLRGLLAAAQKRQEKQRTAQTKQRRTSADPGTAPNTRLKQEVLGDIVSRFESALARAEARSDTTGRAQPNAGKAARKETRPGERQESGRTASKRTPKRAPAKRVARKSPPSSTPAKVARKGRWAKSESAARAQNSRAPRGAELLCKEQVAAGSARQAHVAA